VARRGWYYKAEFPSAEILRFQARNERKISLDKPQQPSRMMCRWQGVRRWVQATVSSDFLPCREWLQRTAACRRRTLWIGLMIV
jgi:hypothetical protein